MAKHALFLLDPRQLGPFPQTSQGTGFGLPHPKGAAHILGRLWANPHAQISRLMGTNTQRKDGRIGARIAFEQKPDSLQIRIQQQIPSAQMSLLTAWLVVWLGLEALVVYFWTQDPSQGNAWLGYNHLQRILGLFRLPHWKGVDVANPRARSHHSGPSRTVCGHGFWPAWTARLFCAWFLPFALQNPGESAADPPDFRKGLLVHGRRDPSI